MAGHLPKKPDEFAKIPGARIAIIASMWHAPCVDRMIARAVRELAGVEVAESDIQIHRVPGSLELPLAARTVFEADPSVDAILAFGVVLKGSTTHDSSVIQQVLHGFSLVTDRFNKPIINEVIGVTDLADAERRSGDDDANKGLEAVFAVSELLRWQRGMRAGRC